MDADSTRNDKGPEPKVAYIGEGVVIKGELSAPDTVVVDGLIEGEVSARCGGGSKFTSKYSPTELQKPSRSSTDQRHKASQSSKVRPWRDASQAR